MAIRTGVRFKPSVYRSSQETINAGLNPSPEGDGPPEGTVVRIVQLVGYNDAEVTTGGNPYRPGDPATERFIYILDEQPKMIDLSAINGKTQNQVNAIWSAVLSDYKTQMQPAVASLVKSEIGVQSAAPSLY